AGVTADSAIWSPDGTWVYFAPDGGAPGLLRIRTDLTGGVETVFEAFHGWPEDISSDGTRLAYNFNGAESIDVAVMDLESGESRVVADSPASDSS
ncbi:hypothetical protein NIL11_27080, partial [Klebsiella pneumoniae]|uniref:TolB family protein n=1 Tax=Klebsiella pneumoniae TaxID=573 RepID=UPI002A261089|nr:hypothetical protein [Klebsiella pneumoniae]